MNFQALDRTALRVLADCIGRIDYDAAEMEAARETLRDAVAAAITAHDAKPEIAPDTFSIRADYRMPAGNARFMILTVEAFSLQEATTKARKELDRRTKGRIYAVNLTVNEGTTND